MRKAFQPSGVSTLSPRIEKASRTFLTEAGSLACLALNSTRSGRARDGETKWAQAGGDTST